MSNPIQPFPLSQLGAMADKQNLACIAGTITALYKPKTGTNSTGEWSIQNATLRGTDGIEVGLWLKDRPELPQSAKGQYVILEARQGEKGLSGLYVMDDDYNGKITRKIKVTPTAELHYGNPPGAAPAGASQLPPQAGPPQTDWEKRQQAAAESWGQEPSAPASQPPPSQNQASQPQAKAAAPDSMKEAERTILQITNLHLTCSRAVIRYEAPTFKKLTGQDMTESQVQGAVASIFIESCRNGLHRNMPTTPLQD